MNTITHSTADVLDAHYDRTRSAIAQHRTAHDGYRERERRARIACDDVTAGREAACADAAAREWERALGAADAIEALADALGVDLAHDRRRADPR